MNAKELLQRVMTEDPSQSQEQMLDTLDEMEAEGRIVLAPRRFRTFKDFFLDLEWNTTFWVAVVLSDLSIGSHILPVGLPLNLFGLPPALVLLFYLPGRSILRITLRNGSLRFMERKILEIGMSILVLLGVGLLLNFSPTHLLSSPVTAAVVGLNLVLAFLASFVEYRQEHLETPTRKLVSSC